MKLFVWGVCHAYSSAGSAKLKAYLQNSMIYLSSFVGDRQKNSSSNLSQEALNWSTQEQDFASHSVNLYIAQHSDSTHCC